jgi:alpha/beta hydrolase fold
MSSTSSHLPTPEGPDSVSGAPHLRAGFTDTFTSHYIDTAELRLHAVIGGEGPPLLLGHGWPENRYAWRLLMPALARDFEVIAVDQRGIRLSEKAGVFSHEARPGHSVCIDGVRTFVCGIIPVSRENPSTIK